MAPKRMSSEAAKDLDGAYDDVFRKLPLLQAGCRRGNQDYPQPT